MEVIFILPTNEQGLKCIYLCQSLTNTYQPIYLVRLDEREGKLFILAGNDIQILISHQDDKEAFYIYADHLKSHPFSKINNIYRVKK